MKTAKNFLTRRLTKYSGSDPGSGTLAFFVFGVASTSLGFRLFDRGAPALIKSGTGWGEGLICFGLGKLAAAATEAKRIASAFAFTFDFISSISLAAACDIRPGEIAAGQNVADNMQSFIR